MTKIVLSQLKNINLLTGVGAMFSIYLINFETFVPVRLQMKYIFLMVVVQMKYIFLMVVVIEPVV